MKKKFRKTVTKAAAHAVTICMLAGAPAAVQAEVKENESGLENRFMSVKMEDRPQVRWWLDQAYHTDETLIQSVNELYEQGYGGIELLCLNDSSIDNSLYGWGSEEWKHDLLVIVEECGKLGMSVSFAAGPDWQPTFLYYGTNEDIEGNSSVEDYYQDYEILRNNGRDVLEAAVQAGSYNVYENDEGILALDPNVDVFNQGVVVDEAVCAAPGETVSIDLTSFTYEPPASSAPAGGPDGPGAPGENPEGEPEADLMGTSVSRTKYTVGYSDLETVTVSKVLEKDASFTRTNIGTFATTQEESTGMKLSADGVEQFTQTELSTDGLISYDEEKETYTLTWTNPYDFEAVLIPEWKVGVGHGTEADSYDYGYMLMVNHFSKAGADAWYAFLKSYILTDDMMELLEKYDIRWDLFIDSLEIGSLGRFYWSNELSDIFLDLNGYDVTPYLPALFSTDYTFEGIDVIENDMRDALTEAYIVFQERLSQNLREDGGELRAQVSYGSTLTTSSAIRAVDVPETESLAFKFSVEAFKLMSGGVHLSGAEEFSSETNNWLGVDYASYNDQLYAVHQQMAAGVNRTVWHGYETQFSSEAVLDWPNNSGGIGCQFGSLNIPTSVLESDFSNHIAILQNVLKAGTETVDVGIMQNDLFIIALNQDGDSKGLLTDDHTLQDKGYSWECFDSSYLWAEEGEYGFQNEDGTLGNPKYKAVVVWDEDLSLNAAKALQKLTEGGLYVVFNTDAAASTTGSAAGDDEELKNIISEIKADTEHTATAAATEEIAEILEGFGVTPRVALEQGVCKEYNKRIYEESLTVGEAYETYDGIWTAMMRDDDANYYYMFNESVDYSMTTEASFEGIFTPYELNTWTGEASPVAEYKHENGRTKLEVSLEPGETAVYIMEPEKEEGEIYITDTDADFGVKSGDGTLEIGAAKDGTYTTTLSNGETVTSEITVEDITWDGLWNVEIEQWTKGELETRTEIRDNIDPYTGETFEYEGSSQHEATELGYTTDKENVLKAEIANKDMVSWKDMYDKGLSDRDLTNVSGVGTYTTVFTASGDKQGIVIDLGDIDGMVGLTVNGESFAVDIDNCQTDISSAVKEGENIVVVTVCTSLTNTLKEGEEGVKRGMQESAPYYPIVYKDLPEAYGLTGPVSITPYGKEAVL
ncbi:MAG: hypothetical protein Q4D16_24700 [Eubacteriales bacterium]|nr:hypothetical protein [Eubacteriales bacterium]